MINDNICSEYTDLIKSEVLGIIDMLYYANSPAKKLLYDMGIYEKDIDIISNIIGEDFDDINDLKNKIQEKRALIIPRMSYISKYVIENQLQN